MMQSITKKTVMAVLFAAAIPVLVSGCQTGPDKQQIGAVTGGILGGVLGSNIGGGSGKTVATIAGTMAGALVGGNIGAHMDAADAERSAQALERNRINQTASWHNPDTGRDIAVTPTRTFRSPSGQDCRDYTTVVVIDGRRETAQGTACRQGDGSWKVSG